MSYSRGVSLMALVPQMALHQLSSSSATRTFCGDRSSHAPASDKELFARRSRLCSRSAVAFFIFHFLSIFSESAELTLIQALTGAPYPHVQYGKPTKHTYDFAEEMLRSRMKELRGTSAESDIQPRLSVAISLPFFPR